MSGSTCAYEGCNNPRDKMVADKYGPSGIPGSVRIERDGDLDFPDPPVHENSELCHGCHLARTYAGNHAMGDFRDVKTDETIRRWRRRLRELDAEKDKPHGLAALHGYQDKVRLMIKPPEEVKEDQA